MISKTYKSLKKTRNLMFNAVSVVTGKKKLDDDLIDEFEEKILLSDLGYNLTQEIVSKLKLSVKSSVKVEVLIKETIIDFLNEVNFFNETRSSVIMISGVNGTGKTTTCAKLANYFKNKGNKVLVVAADTFRAAAQEQINQWCLNNGIDCFNRNTSKDPSSIIFEALNINYKQNYDKIIIDTAGRLHTSLNLMSELNKMERVIEKFENFYESWLSVDATSGRNALSQVENFKKHLKVNGIILNKMDGSAKGGVAIPIMKNNNIPVKFIGTGEKINDIESFNLNTYLDGLFNE